MRRRAQPIKGGNMRKILKPIAVATLASLSGSVVAQNVVNEPTEEIVVVGHIVAGEKIALDAQHDSDRIINVISADGIGKLPDRNAAEAVQRVPGLSIERDQGEGRFVAVRGLPSQWSSASVNGDRLPTAEEETTSRATAFDFFPSEMIERVEVTKALTPDMEADAIGGNVNFVTRNAPEKRTLQTSLGYGFHDKANGDGYAASVVWGDRVLNDRLGFLVNATAWERDWATDNYEPRREDLGIFRLELRDYTGTRETYGFNGVMEYRFDNGDKVFARGLYGTLEDDETHFKHRYRFDRNRVELQHIFNILNTEFAGFELGGAHGLGEAFALDWKLSSYANHFYYGDVPNGRDNSYFVARFDQRNVGYTGLEDRGTGTNLAYNTVDGGTDPWDGVSTHLPAGYTANPANATLSSIELYRIDVREKDRIVAQLDFSHDTSEALQLKFGVKYRDKERTARFSDEFYTWNAALAGRPAPTLGEFSLRDQPGRRDYLDGDVSRDYQRDFFPVASRNQMVALWNQNRQFFTLDTVESQLVSNGLALGRHFDVAEEHLAGYGMAEINVGDRITVVGGVRLENTQTDVDGQLYLDDTATLQPVRSGKSYLSWLPSLQVKFSPTEQTNYRFALTRTFARPDFGSLSPGGTYSEADNEFFSGNPGLDPTYSWNLDVMAEHYFADIGIVSAGLFYKRITDPIFQDARTGSFNGNSGVVLIRPENGDDAWLAGAELTFNRRLDFLDNWARDFGLMANVTFMDSQMRIPGRDEDVAIPRQADMLYNAAVYFDNGRFAARLAVNYKDEYIEEHGESSTFDRYYGEYTAVDLSVSYQITDQLLAYAEANNLTDEPLLYYVGTKDRPGQVEYYGMRGQLGVKFSF
jgi:TonB-dependent receptor